MFYEVEKLFLLLLAGFTASLGAVLGLGCFGGALIVRFIDFYARFIDCFTFGDIHIKLCLHIDSIALLFDEFSILIVR